MGAIERGERNLSFRNLVLVSRGSGDHALPTAFGVRKQECKTPPVGHRSIQVLW
jgi:hypothetical protein